MATPKQTDPQFKLRLPQKLKDQIEASSVENNRSMNAEIVDRLEQSVLVHKSEVGPSTDDDRLPLPAPRMLNSRKAADYVGLPLPDFNKKCSVKALKIGRYLLYDRKLLDVWVDSLTVSNTDKTAQDWLSDID